VPVELAPLEPIDKARLEESRASVREAIVTMLPVLEAQTSPLSSTASTERPAISPAAMAGRTHRRASRGRH
jgi:hypothetical protein